jgi:hypothetical protein
LSIIGQVATPLTTLLKNEAFSWTQEETKYFEKPKEVMYATHIIAMHEFTKKIYYGV